MKSKIRQQIYKDVFRFIWIPICICVFIACFEGILAVFCANTFGEFADAVFCLNFSVGLENVYRLALVLLATILLVPALSFILDVILIRQAMAHDRRILGRFLDKNCIAAQQADAGDMLERLDSDPNDLRQKLLEILPDLIMIPFTLIYLLNKVLQISVLYTSVVIAVSMIKFFVPLLVRKREQKYHQEDKEYVSAMRSYETEITDRPYLVDLFGLATTYIHRFEGLYRQYFDKTKKNSICLSVLTGVINSFLDTFCVLIILLIGAYSVAKGWFSPGAVAAMIGYFAVFNKIIANINTIIRELPILKNLEARLEYFYEDAESVAGTALSTFEQIRVSNLAFSYEEKPILDAVSFEILEGDKVVLCGKNGSGKSTILKILLGLVGGYQGEIEINGIDFSDISIQSFRKLVAYAPQNPYLFKGTVLENIQIANPEAQISEITNWMKRLEIESLAAVALDYDGNELSGGEKQKISVIRAMIKNSPVIFIDEPENHLDSKAMEEIERLLQINDKTIIYVSHNDKLIACANKKIHLV